MIRVVRPESGSRIRILIFYPSRIPGSKSHRIPDPQHYKIPYRTGLLFYVKISNIPALVVLFSGCCPLGLHGFSVDGVGAGRLNTRKNYASKVGQRHHLVHKETGLNSEVRYALFRVRSYGAQINVEHINRTIKSSNNLLKSNLHFFFLLAIVTLYNP